jgi:hypothetical protein
MNEIPEEHFLYYMQPYDHWRMLTGFIEEYRPKLVAHQVELRIDPEDADERAEWLVSCMTHIVSNPAGNPFEHSRILPFAWRLDSDDWLLLTSFVSKHKNDFVSHAVEVLEWDNDKATEEYEIILELLNSRTDGLTA